MSYKFTLINSYIIFLCSDEKARGDHNESVLASYLETSTTSQAEQPQICKLIFIVLDYNYK